MEKMDLIIRNFKRNGWLVRDYIGFDRKRYIGFTRKYIIPTLNGTADEGNDFVCSFDVAEQDIPFVGVILDIACQHVENPEDFTKFHCCDERNSFSFKTAAYEMKHNLEDRIKESKEILKRGLWGYCSISFRRMIHFVF